MAPLPPATPSERSASEAPARERGSALEVLLAFLRLGLTSFGGPVALGYFRTEFVERRRWLDDRGYSDLVALCQFLPGPASSQVGMALGLSRAGWAGALMAWLGFTLPSAFALIAFAYGIVRWGDLAASGAVQGLKVAAVAVVAQAVWGMARSLCPDRPRAGLAIFAALLTLALPSAIGQVGAIVASGLIGWRLVQVPHQEPVAHPGYRVSRGAAVAALTLLLVLLLVAALPFWDELRQRDAVQSAMAGVNAGVVGILLSALYDPVWTSAIHGRTEFGIALAAFGLLVYARVSPVFVVALSAAAGWAWLG